MNCVNKVQAQVMPENFEMQINSQNVEWIMEATDCFMDAFKLKTGLLAGIERCIDDFEDKRTEKWQKIFDKMNEKVI